MYDYDYISAWLYREFPTYPSWMRAYLTHLIIKGYPLEVEERAPERLMGKKWTTKERDLFIDMRDRFEEDHNVRSH